MNRSLIVAGLLCAGLAFAQNVPGSISFNARLTDVAGAPVTGGHAIGVGLYDQPSGGAALWSENHAAATFSADGLTFLELGSVTPLTATALDGRKLYLEVSVDGTTMSPRLAVVSVPYAIRASVAGSVGSLTEAMIQRRVASGCNAGQAVRSIDSTGAVVCETVSPGPQGPAGPAGPAGPSLFSVATTRPATPAAGAFFVNSATGNVEIYDGTAWKVYAPKLPASCRQVLAENPGSPDSVYTIQPTWGGPPVQVNCEMTTLGGGWTQVVACLPSDNCTVGSTVVMNADWFGADLGTVSSTGSYSQGRSLKGLITGGVATNFMVRVTNVVTSRAGNIIYPLNPDTENYFSTDLGWWSASNVPATVIDFNGTTTAQNLGLCHTDNNDGAIETRNLAGVGGVSFLGNTTAAPTQAPSGGCDYGPYTSQMLMRRPANGMTNTWGINAVTSWMAGQHSHKIYVR